VTAWGNQPSLFDTASELVCALAVCDELSCKPATLDLLEGSRAGSATEQREQQQQRLLFEQQLWLLLPAVLLPSAHHLLTKCDPGAWWAAAAAQQLIGLSRSAVRTFGQLLTVQATACDGLNLPCQRELLSPAWGREVLGSALQLAPLLFVQQQPIQAAAGVPGLRWQAAHFGGSATASISGINAEAAAVAKAECMLHLLLVLCLVTEWQGIIDKPGSSGNTGSSQKDTTLVAADTVVAVAAAVETGLRAVTAAVQSGMISREGFLTDVSYCVNTLLVKDSKHGSAFERRMGLSGPGALAQEQRQFHSLLSTLLKVGRCTSAGAQSSIEQVFAGRCCLAAGQAAVRLLGMAPRTEQQCQASVIAAAQQWAGGKLASLVIWGRCCLQWAEQLQQQAPELLQQHQLMVSGTPQQQQRVRSMRDAVLGVEGAAVVCIPGLRQGEATMAGSMMELENLIAQVSNWAAAIQLPAAQLAAGGNCVMREQQQQLQAAAATTVQLAAAENTPPHHHQQQHLLLLAQLTAADCTPPQLQQQLQALLAAQQETQQGLTDASLAALVQQLQAIGAMLSNIPVPHFCNNPACGNISGPTEVQLVSGRSCVCAGCRMGRYCGRDCQRAAWKQHKPVCKALAAAVATRAAVTVE
jgi:hypothetical protein